MRSLGARLGREVGVCVCVGVAALALGCGRTDLDLGYAPPARAPMPVDAAVAPAPLAREFQSCEGGGPGLDDCGPNKESCCTTLPVPAGMFFRSYDAVSCPGGPAAPPPPALGCYLRADHPATISAFRLDKYLVTIGRFRAYLASVGATGWRPAEGDGRHAHLNGGRGLADVGTGGFEPGWSAAWSDDTITFDPGYDGYTALNVSENGIPWAEAYAFCIWDGGFLPSEAEWNYAAAGGEQQRVYPWSSPPQDTTVDCAHAAYSGTFDPAACVESTSYPVGAKSPTGDGRWGQADLAGLRGEWTLDWLTGYVDPCVDCANLRQPDSGAASRAVRGYSHVGVALPPHLLTSVRDDDSYGVTGFRCARAP